MLASSSSASSSASPSAWNRVSTSPHRVIRCRACSSITWGRKRGYRFPSDVNNLARRRRGDASCGRLHKQAGRRLITGPRCYPAVSIIHRRRHRESLRADAQHETECAESVWLRINNRREKKISGLTSSRVVNPPRETSTGKMSSLARINLDSRKQNYEDGESISRASTG